MSISLWDWQRADIEKLARHRYTGMLNIQPGGTKTAISTGAAVHSGADSVLVIGPQGTFGSAWTPTVRSLADKEIRQVGNATKAQRQAKDDMIWGRPGWYFTTPQLLTRDESVSDWSGDLLIADEGHMLTAAKSKGQRAFSGYDIRKDNPISRRFESRMYLSGTPFRNKFERAWSVMRFLWPELDGQDDPAYFNYHSWLHARTGFVEVFTSQRDRFGNPKKAKVWGEEIEPGRLLSEAPCVIQHFRRERCCEWHPNGFLSQEEPQIVERVVPLLPAQKKIIDDLETQMLAWVEDHPLVVDLTITQQQRVRQVCLGVPNVTTTVTEDEETGNETTKSVVTFENADKSPFADELESILEAVAPEPVVVFLQSQSFAAALVKRLNANGFPAFEYSGKTKSTRDQMLQQFGTQYQVAVVQIDAGGTGVDQLQHVSKTDVFLEESADEANNIQARARLDRTGARGQVQRFVLTDELGYAKGAMSDRLTKQIMLNRSSRKVVN